jgi:DNA helicase II / ATP-dependent DNA helicase PcrA
MESTIASFPQIIPNLEQQECIQTINGPVMVLAGPGTGKTTTIIKRIEYMLGMGVNPEKILALTFSDAAATEMKVRLLDQVGIKASSVLISTYHAFCSDLISLNTLQFEVIDDYNVIDELNKYRLMQGIIDDFKPRNLIPNRQNRYFYIPYLLNAVHDIKLNRITKQKYFDTIENGDTWKLDIARLKEEHKVHEQLKAAGKRNRLVGITKEIESLELKIKKAIEIWEVFERYNKKLYQYSYIDFDDMINFVLDAFEEDHLFLDRVRTNFDYILVDEYQDTNHSQNELIFKLASTSPDANIFVVGDDDQIVYAFQGAQIDNLERFLRNYPTAKVICLKENNRSTQQILDFSYEIISQDCSRLENNLNFTQYEISKKLLAANKNILNVNTEVELHSFADTIQENNYIVEEIENLIAKNPDIELSEIAILARKNSELDNFANLLKAKGISYQLCRQKDIFSLKPSILVYLYLKALENNEMYSMGLFSLVAHPPFSFSTEDYMFLLTEYRKYNEDFITLIRKNLKKHSWKNIENIEKFINDFDELKASINDDSLSNLIINMINITGMLGYFASKEDRRFENIASLKKMIDEVKNFEKITKPATLTMLLSYLDSAVSNNLSLEIDNNGFIENAVQLVTVHKSKGREFSYVFMTNLLAKNWEKRRSSQNLTLPIVKPEFSTDSEMARLLFVGCSRAKHTLILTYSNMVNGKTTELSRFIARAIDNGLPVKKFNHEMDNEDYLNEMIKQYIISPLYQKKDFLVDLRARAKKHIMSPSSLYLYNACPRQFLYAYIYRIPQAEVVNSSLSFGTAMHNALEKYIKQALKQSSYPDREKLIKYYQQSMEKVAFPSVQDRDIRLNQGINVLASFYARLTSVPIKNIKGIEVNIDLIPIENHFIKGKIDRIDQREGLAYEVIDYKTGNAKYKNQILKDDGSHYHYFEQLCFYKLLFELKNDGTRVTDGKILFLEEPEKSVGVELISSDRDGIQEKILSTFDKITNLEFTGVDEMYHQADACKTCVYKFLCKISTL